VNNFLAEFERRVRQFQHYLELHDRGLRTADEDGFLIIQEYPSASDFNSKRLKVSLKQPVKSWATVGPSDETADELDDTIDETEDRVARFVQFSFWEKFVVCDLPNTTLSRFEGRQIIRDMPGFGYVRERPDYPYYRNDVPTFDPLQKQYLPDDLESAASDAARILVHIWHFPVGTRLYLTATTFCGVPSWESDLPIS
jgi:hypothetical protein